MNRFTHTILMILIGGTLVLPPGWCCVDWMQVLRQQNAVDGKPVAAVSTCSACCKASKALAPEEDSKPHSCPINDSEGCSCQDRNATRTNATEAKVTNDDLATAVLLPQLLPRATSTAYSPVALRQSSVAIHILKCVWQI